MTHSHRAPGHPGIFAGARRLGEGVQKRLRFPQRSRQVLTVKGRCKDDEKQQRFYWLWGWREESSQGLSAQETRHLASARVSFPVSLEAGRRK